MASWSDEYDKPKCIYDVFINFRGQDTRRNLVSHLYASLSNAGAFTFLDNETFPKGMELGPELLRAIEASRVSIVVFSENYTDSNWCLIELCKIMECHRNHDQLVLPIFYGIDPSVVRHQKGAFGKALQASAEKVRTGEDMNELLSSWRSALTEAANLSGWDVTNFRSESELVKKIVEKVLTKLDVTLLSNVDFPVGLESRVQKVIEFIESQSSKVCMVGIWGMGGLGKTTTAKDIYNRIHRRFEDRSFIENIREVCENDSRGGPMHLQEQLLSDVVKTKVKKIRSISAGTTMFKKRLTGRRALVVLDDVTTCEQLKALCGNRKWFGQGSVIIVTTRDVRLLKSLKVDYVYKMEEMDEKESLELLSWHAFGEASPRKDLIELSRSVVAYCGGLPLALQVLGSYLYDRTEQEWKSVLSKLKRIPNDQVQEKLIISYDGLKDDMEKDIFLDICCFFIGKNRADATDILNGCGLYADIGITVLIERSLVKVGKNNKLQMHDLLRDMGREIVRGSSSKDPGKRSRLWFHEDVHDVLTQNTGTETVEGLVLKLQKSSRVCFSANAFKEMRRLRLLQLDCVDLAGDYRYLSQELRWVCWQRFNSKYIPDDLYLGNLVAMDLKYNSVKQVWKETQLLEKLKILNLSHCRCLENTPDFSKLPNLEKLILKDCPNLTKLHQSIGDLTNLLLINLKDCTSLTLPRKIYQLKSLKTFILSGCSKIYKLEEDIVQMESLTTLIAKDTAIKEVPYSILRFKSIGYISLCGYEGSTCDIFPSLIRSWMSPTMNPLSRIPQFRGMSLALVSNSRNLSPWLSSLSNLRSVWIQCDSESQVTQESRRIIDDKYDANYSELETTSLYEAQIPSGSLRSLLIRLGSCDTIIDTLGRSISQGLTTNDSCNFSFPCDNHPSWLAYKGDGPSVNFQVPKDRGCCLKGIALCAVYSFAPGNMATECLTSVLIINYTKFTIQIYKQDTAMSFNDEDWESVVSNLDPGDNMEIVVAFGHRLTVKETTVYLIYGPSITMKIEPSIKVQIEPLPQVSVMSLPNVEMEPLPEVNVQPLPIMEMEPSPELNMQPLSEVKMELSPEVSVHPSANVEKEHSPEVYVQPLPIVEMEPLPEVNLQPLLGVEMQPSPGVDVHPLANVEMKPSPEVSLQPSTNVEMELSPEVSVHPSANVEMELSPEVNVQPLPNVEMEPSPAVNLQTLPEVEMQPSLEVNVHPSANVEMKPSPEVNLQPSTNVEVESSPKPNKNILTRLGECLCLSQK